MSQLLMERGVGAPVQRSIRRAQPGERATLVVKQGGRLPLQLVFAEVITVRDVRTYCIGQCAWNIHGLGVAIDGQHYEGPDSDAILLQPTTAKVEFGAQQPSHLEFRKKSSGKG